MKFLPLPLPNFRKQNQIVIHYPKKAKLGASLYYALFSIPSFLGCGNPNKHLYMVSTIKYNTINFWPPSPPPARKNTLRLSPYLSQHIHGESSAVSASDRPKHPIEEEVVNQSAGNKTTFSRGRLLCSDDNNGRMHLCVQGASM